MRASASRRLPPAWGLVPPPTPHRPLLPAPGGPWQVEGARGDWWPPPSPERRGHREVQREQTLLPSPRNAPTHGLHEAGPKLTRPRRTAPGCPVAGRWAGPPRASPPAPGGAPGPSSGPKGTHLLIRPACSCWRPRGGAAGGRCSGSGPQRPPRRRAPPLSSRPPACEAPGTGQVGVGRALLPAGLRIRSTVET